MIKRGLALVVFMTVVFLAPFINFGGAHKNNFEQVVRDAAAHFGIEEHEYEIQFLSGRFLSAGTNAVQGNIRMDFSEELTRKYVITIHTSLSRPMVISTIFHEFAHAAQDKFRYSMYFGNYNKEQHAEILAFHAMWNSRYWWDALHMLTMHTFPMKPSEYRIPRTLWKIFATGENVLNFHSQAV